jgi:hypothetical protein
MKSMLKPLLIITMRVHLLALCFFLVPCLALSRELAFGDSTYQPTCSKAEWAKFDAWLVKVADARKPTEIVNLAKSYLCGRGNAANRAIQRAMPAALRYVASGSGQADLVERRSRTQFKVRVGEFWGAQIEDDGQDIHVFGFVNEACGHSARFRYVASRWLIVEVGDACD